MESWMRGAAVVAVMTAAAPYAWAQVAAPVVPPAGQRRPAAPAVAPVAPVARPAVAAPTLPEPPIPVQHATQAGVGKCLPAIDQLSRSGLGVPYNAQSMWNQANPAGHIFQSVAGLKNVKNSPPSGMVAIVAAPVGPETCDAVAVEVYPLAGTCADVQRAMAKGGEVESNLEDIKVISDLQKRRLFLMPGFGATCIAVSVNSFYGSP